MVMAPRPYLVTATPWRTPECRNWQRTRAWDELDASYRPSGLALPKAFDKPAMLFVSMAEEGDSSDIISRRPLECRGLVPLLTWTICCNVW